MHYDNGSSLMITPILICDKRVRTLLVATLTRVQIVLLYHHTTHNVTCTKRKKISVEYYEHMIWVQIQTKDGRRSVEMLSGTVKKSQAIMSFSSRYKSEIFVVSLNFCSNSRKSEEYHLIFKGHLKAPLGSLAANDCVTAIHQIVDISKVSIEAFCRSVISCVPGLGFRPKFCEHN